RISYFLIPLPPTSTLFPYTTLFRSHQVVLFAVLAGHLHFVEVREHADLIDTLLRPPDDQRNLELHRGVHGERGLPRQAMPVHAADRKSTRLNSSHVAISYAVFCLKK